MGSFFYSYFLSLKILQDIPLKTFLKPHILARIFLRLNSINYLSNKIRFSNFTSIHQQLILILKA